MCFGISACGKSNKKETAVFRYDLLEDGNYAVCGVEKCTDELIIPDEHDGKPVVEISDGAFRAVANFSKITLGNNIVSIGANAFSNCVGLTEITLGKTVQSIGKSAFSGCNLNVIYDTEFDIETEQSPFLGANIGTFTVGKNAKKVPKLLLQNTENIHSVIVTDGVQCVAETPYGHKQTTVQKKDATCSSVGWEEYTYCTECEYTTYREIPKLSHNFENDVCKDCGAFYYSDCVEKTAYGYVIDVVPTKNLHVTGNFDGKAFGYNTQYLVEGDLTVSGEVEGLIAVKAVGGDAEGTLKVNIYSKKVLVSFGELCVEVELKDLDETTKAVTEVVDLIRKSFNKEELGISTVLDIAEKYFENIEIGVSKEGNLRITFDELQGGLSGKVQDGILYAEAENGSLEFALTDKVTIQKLDGENVISKDGLIALAESVATLNDVFQKDEYNVSLNAVIKDGDEKFAKFDGVRYTVLGSVYYKKATETDGEILEISLSAYGSREDDFYGKFTFVDKCLYVEISYYEANNENYKPLKIKGGKEDFEKIAMKVKEYVGYDFDFLGTFEEISTTATETVTEARKTVLDDIVKAVILEDGNIVINVSADELYGYDEKDITATVSVGKDAPVSLAVTDVAYSRKDGRSVNLTAELLEDEYVFTKPTGSYIGVDCFDEFVQSVFDSFGIVTDDTVYALDEYHFVGSVGFKLGFISYHPDLAISVNSRKKIVTASVEYSSDSPTNRGRYQTFVTFDFKNQLVYMQRNQTYYFYEPWGVKVPISKKYDTPIVTYRAMTLDDFLSTLGEQLWYIFNFNSTVGGLVEDIKGSTSSEESERIEEETSNGKNPYDFGCYVKNYGYTDGDGIRKYSVKINGEKLNSNLGDIDVDITTNDQKKVEKIVGNVHIVLDMDISLTYENVTSTDGTYSLPFTDLKETWARSGYEIARIKTDFVTEKTENIEDILEYVAK